MSSADDGDPEQKPSADYPGRFGPARTDTLLVETLIHALLEKGVLTKNDALSVVQTVVQVRRGSIHDGTPTDSPTETDIHMLRRMYESFEMLEGRDSDVYAAGNNIYPLRPPVHGNYPEFPGED